MYNKLFCKILDSSIWLESDPVRLVWITLLAAMDENSYAHFSAIGNLALRARVSIEDAEQAVDKFSNPDPDSGDPEYSGRRIERVPGGFLILNGQKYRSQVTKAVAQEMGRERVRRWRERKKEGCNAELQNGNGRVTQSEADTDTDTDTEKPPIVPKGDAVVDTVLRTYHDALPNCQHVSAKTPKRCKRIQTSDKLARVLCHQQGWEYETEAFWTAYFGECAMDPWMRGDVPHAKNPRWRQNIEVLLHEDRFAGIMDRAISSMRKEQAA